MSNELEFKNFCLTDLESSSLNEEIGIDLSDCSGGIPDERRLLSMPFLIAFF
jgi:hypothetical protein